MKIYTVIDQEINYEAEFYNLNTAKAAMREHPNARGYITIVRPNGDTINGGEIRLNSSNKTFIANLNKRATYY